MKLKPLARVYALSVSIIGGVLGVLCLIEYVRLLMASSNLASELMQVAVLFLFAVLCRCLPVYFSADRAADISFIACFAILLCKGPFAAAAVILATTPFVITQSAKPDRRFDHAFNTPFLQTAFMTANLIIACTLAGFVFKLTGGVIGRADFPEVFLPSLAMFLTLIAVNILLTLAFLRINYEVPFFKTLANYAVEFIMLSVAALPIGYFCAVFFQMQEWVYLILLMFIPLLFARISFSTFVNVKQNYFIMMKTMTNTLEAKDLYTSGHSERVEAYARIIASEMHLQPSRITDLSVAALLHDVGKIGIDENILLKPDRLSTDERRIIQTHPEISVHILKDVKLSNLTLNIILHHHERYDGFGYPEGVGGGELPMEVYAIGVADTYDAITSDRPYSRGRTPQDARDIIVEESGHQFHPAAVEAFLRAYEKGKLSVCRRPGSRPFSISRLGDRHGAKYAG